MSGSESEAPKYFTVDEARSLVPQLRGLVTAIQTEKQRMDEEIRGLAALTPTMRANGHAVEAARHEARISELADAIQQHIDDINGMGIEVKDLDMGLVDFPSIREDRVVYLCWRVDEPTVDYWHELDTGYQDRHPLDE